MTAQKFVKEKYPNAKDMYRDEAGHAIMYYDTEFGKTVTLSYGSTSAKAWKNAKENIDKTLIKEIDETKTPEWKLRNSIGMQLMFYTHSGLSMEETISHIYQRAINYSNELQKKVYELERDYMAIQEELRTAKKEYCNLVF